MPADPVESQARRVIGREGYTINEEWALKALGPDCDGEREVLFRGRFTGSARPHDEDTGCYRCVVRGDGTGYVRAGW